MLNYIIDFPTNDLLSKKIEEIKNKIYILTEELIETNWKNGLITKIYGTVFKEYKVEQKIVANISYMIYDDPNYKEEQERMEIGI